MPKLGTADPVFYRRWIVANGWSEAAGLGTTFVLGRALAPWLEHATGAVVVLLGVLAAVLLGTLLEGVLVGVAQEAVLRDRLASLRKRTWMLATAAGAAFAWLLGMPLIFLGMEYVPWTGPSAATLLAIYGVCGAVGLVVGAVHGQFLVELVRPRRS